MLFPTPGAMKIKSGMVFFTFWLSETYRGWYLTLFITFFRILIFSDILGVFLMPKFRQPGPPGKGVPIIPASADKSEGGYNK